MAPVLRRPIARLALLGVLCALPALGAARAEGQAPVLSPSGLPLPRFVSLDADKVNIRTGPGVRYPIAWVFVRRDMPVEVTAEFDLWRKLRDIDGAGGWAHKSLLSGRRWAIVTGEVRALHRDPDETSSPVLFAEPGVQGRLVACRRERCKLEIQGLGGWLKRTQLWGVHPWELFE
ncbi:MAG: SH3 domain-containing protein [Alphaproteobacteria bacterium]